jgi:hypothetical protein
MRPPLDNLKMRDVAKKSESGIAPHAYEHPGVQDAGGEEQDGLLHGQGGDYNKRGG